MNGRQTRPGVVKAAVGEDLAKQGGLLAEKRSADPYYFKTFEPKKDQFARPGTGKFMSNSYVKFVDFYVGIPGISLLLANIPERAAIGDNFYEGVRVATVLHDRSRERFGEKVPILRCQFSSTYPCICMYFPRYVLSKCDGNMVF